MIKERQFYQHLVAMMIPLVIQEIINFCVQMLDTVMVGSLGDAAVSAVTLAGQPFFIFNVFAFGLTSAGAVMISQYWGQKNIEKIKHIMSVMLWSVIVVSVLYMGACWLFPRQIIHLFASDEKLVELGVSYLQVVVVSYLLNGLSMWYFSSLSAKENVKISAAVYTGSFFVNLICNYLLIYGNFGFPKLGVVGAAIGTIVARAFQLVCASIYARYHERDIRFGLRDIFDFDKTMIPTYFHLSLPVIGDDLIWSLAVSTQLAIIGRMSSDYVAAASIASIAQQFVMILVYSMTKSATITTGKAVGQGDYERVKQIGRTFLVLSAFVGIIACGVVLFIRTPVLSLYPNVTVETKNLAYQFMTVIADIMLFTGIENAAIVGILRGAGDMHYAFRIDAGCMWFIGLPMGLLAAFVWKLPVTYVYFFLRFDIIFKIILCIRRILKGEYIKDFTRDPAS